MILCKKITIQLNEFQFSLTEFDLSPILHRYDFPMMMPSSLVEIH